MRHTQVLAAETAVRQAPGLVAMQALGLAAGWASGSAATMILLLIPCVEDNPPFGGKYFKEKHSLIHEKNTVAIAAHVPQKNA